MENKEEIIYIFWAGTAMVVCFAVGLVVIILLYQKHLFTLRQKKTQALLKVSLEAENSERKRIARDLHDSLLGDLSAIRNYLSVLENSITERSSLALLGEIKTGVEAAVESTREISHKLMPPLLENFGLGVALEHYCKKISLAGKTQFVLQNERCVAISPSMSFELFRIIQEFCQNISKHGNAKGCKIKMYKSNYNIIVEIIDDGNSFCFAQAVNISTGNGLKNIQARIQLIEAKLTQLNISVGNHFRIETKDE